ncbi:hypothetical protein OPV22_007593 [Ensete ventricosum]|uniref:Uncharacterized protein n=1 Tax=Ensete ventricosum TaxID=4639 RepID=A0AAV8QER1_ENSVE|nr:hypothetical protein OPV22_007593 [Ensete ventricosum]
MKEWLRDDLSSWPTSLHRRSPQPQHLKKKSRPITLWRKSSQHKREYDTATIFLSEGDKTKVKVGEKMSTSSSTDTKGHVWQFNWSYK